jgi:hypothetical protein
MCGNRKEISSLPLLGFFGLFVCYRIPGRINPDPPFTFNTIFSNDFMFCQYCLWENELAEIVAVFCSDNHKIKIVLIIKRCCYSSFIPFQMVTNCPVLVGVIFEQRCLIFNPFNSKVQAAYSWLSLSIWRLLI